MDNIYYISQGETVQEHLKHIAAVCRAGVQSVQLRLKEVSLESYIRVAEAAKGICDRYQAHLVINDNVDVARSICSPGIHLGKKDMNPSEASAMVCENMIIGGTANTIEDCLELIKQKVDYIGLGPFRHTETKKELSPTLGVEGYKNILKTLKSLGHTTPVYAIGGITEDDLDDLYATGVYGVAVSGMLSHSSEEQLEKKIERCREKLKARN